MRSLLIAITVLAVSATTAAAATPAYMLASIDTGGPPSAKTVRKYDRALDLLTRHCTNTRINLSDDSVTTQRLLRKSNIDRTNLRILRAVYPRVQYHARHNCTRDFAAYVTATRRSS